MRLCSLQRLQRLERLSNLERLERLELLLRKALEALKALQARQRLAWVCQAGERETRMSLKPDASAGEICVGGVKAPRPSGPYAQ